MNVLEEMYGADHDTITDGKWEVTGKVATAFVAFQGAVVTEVKDANGVAVTKNYITAGTTLESGTFCPFGKPFKSVTVTGTVMVFGIRDAQ